MKLSLSALLVVVTTATGVLAQDTPPPAPPAPPASSRLPAPPAPPDAPLRIGIEGGKDVTVAQREVSDIIGIGGRVNVRDSRARLLGGFAGDVNTNNSSFERVVLAAGNVNMSGGSVGKTKIAAGDVTLNLSVTDDIHVAGGEVMFGEDMSVRGDTSVHAATANIAGSYAGDVEINAETAIVEGNFGGDLRINAKKIILSENTKVGGDLRAPSLAALPEGVVVGGDVRIASRSRTSNPGGAMTSPEREADRIRREAARVERAAEREEQRAEQRAERDAARAERDAARAERDVTDATRNATQAKIDDAQAKIDDALRNLDIDADVRDAVKKIARDKMVMVHDDDDNTVGLISPEPLGMAAWLTVLVTLALCGALALGAAPQFVVRATERLAKEPLPSLGIGAASLIAVPALLVGVSITIIGIPFAILGAAAYVIGIGLGLIALCLWGGLMVRTITNQPGQETRVSKLVGWTLMGFLALALLGAIPFVGRWLQFAAVMTGAGAVISTAWAMRNERKAAMPQPA